MFNGNHLRSKILERRPPARTPDEPIDLSASSHYETSPQRNQRNNIPYHRHPEFENINQSRSVNLSRFCITRPLFVNIDATDNNPVPINNEVNDASNINVNRNPFNHQHEKQSSQNQCCDYTQEFEEPNYNQHQQFYTNPRRINSQNSSPIDILNIPGIINENCPVTDHHDSTHSVPSQFKQGFSKGYHPLMKDIVPLILEFDPAKNSLNSFLQNVDRVVAMYRPDELMLIHAVTLKLKNNARKWYESLNTNYRSWQSLRSALLSEFSELRDDVDIHRELEKRKRGSHEDVIDFAYEMRRISAESNIEEKNVIKYIITNLNNSNLTYSLSVMKINTFSELMMRLRTHKSITSSNSNTAVVQSYHRNNSNYQPGKQPHREREHPYRRITCAYCKKDGHYAVDCHLKKPNQTKIESTTNVKSINCVVAKSEYTKNINLNGASVEAFIDLGSECTIVNQIIADKVFSTYERCEQKLRGFGNGMCTAVGKAIGKIEMDGIVFADCEVLIVKNVFQPSSVIIGQNVINRDNIIAIKGYNFFKFMNICPYENNLSNVVSYFQPRKQREVPDFTVMSIETDDFRRIMLDSISGEVDQPVKDSLMEMFCNFRKCFAMNMNEIGLTTKAEIEIKLKDDKPVCYQPYRLSYSQREIVMAHVKEMLDNKIISPSSSPYASPIVIVKKKSGEDRICVDYRKLNNKTIKDHYPLPNMEDQLHRLAGMNYYSVVDMASGYYQIGVAKESRAYTAFVTPDGKYEFNRMPFGLTNAPSAFQRMVNEIACELNNQIITYLDDVVIASKTIEEGVNLLKLFMETIQKYGLTLKPSKCKFLQRQIEFLGHEVSPAGIRPGKNKILCVEQFEIPVSVRDVRRFIGLASYFRKFVPNFATIAKPLTDLTKKNVPFVWSDAQNKAFNQLKSYLTNRETLALYDPSKPHEVHTDASAIGLAGILIQVEEDGKRPVAYFSRKTNSVEHTYHSYELETLAVVESVERFRVYVLGKPFIVVTDCESLRTSSTKKNLIPRVARWWLRLQEFDFEVRHRTGSQMIHVDALSRAPVLEEVEVEGATLDVFSIGDENKWMISIQKTDPDILKIKNKILSNDPSMKSYVVRDDCVYFKTENDEELFIVPSCLRSRLVSEVHSTGHFGVEKTLGVLKKNYWFKNMRPYIKRHLSSCVECLFQKEKGGAQGIELHPIEKIPIPQHTWHIDHLGPFVKSSRKNAYIIAIVDAFTKYVHLKAAKDTSTKFVIRAMDDIAIHFGSPSRVITDRGSGFTSKSFEKYCIDSNISHVLNATATPRANGQVERINRILVNSLRTMVNDNEQNWDSKLREIQWAINSSTSSVTKKSPFELLYGYTPRSILKTKLTLQLEDEKVVSERNDFAEKRDNNRREASQNIAKHQQYSKQYFDSKHKKPDVFQVGDLVMVKRETTSTGTSTKLQQRYRGPYQIIDKMHGDRYRLTDISVAENKRKFTGVFPSEKLKFVERPEESSDGE